MGHPIVTREPRIQGSRGVVGKGENEKSPKKEMNKKKWFGRIVGCACSTAALFRTLANSTFASVLCARFPPLHLNLIFLFEKESTAPAATNSAKLACTGSHPSFSRVSEIRHSSPTRPTPR